MGFGFMVCNRVSGLGFRGLRFSWFRKSGFRGLGVLRKLV